MPAFVFLALLGDLGLGSAILRAERVTPDQLSATFSFSLLVGVAGGVLLLALAPLMSYAANETSVRDLVAGLSLAFFFLIGSVVPRATLERNLLFKQILVIEVISVTSAAATGILAALLTQSAISIVFFYVTLHALRFFQLVLAQPTRLSLSLNIKLAVPFLKVGGWVLAFSLQNFVLRNADNILVGIHLGTAALGLYALSYQIMVLPLMLVTWPAGTVIVAWITRLRGRGADWRPLLEALMRLSGAVSGSVCAFVLLFARDVEALLGPTWVGLASVAVILAPLSVAQSFGSFLGAVLIAIGRARENFYTGLFFTAVVLTTFLVSVRQGIFWFSFSYALVGSAVALISVLIIAVVARARPLAFVVRVTTLAVVFFSIEMGAGLVFQLFVPDASLPLRFGLYVFSGGIAAAAAFRLWCADVVLLRKPIES